MKKLITYYLLFLVISFSACQKECEECKEVTIERTVVVKNGNTENILLESSNDTVSFYFEDVASESRCVSWYYDPNNTCNSLCGKGRIFGLIEINSDTAFAFNYFINGCRFVQISPQIDMRRNNIKVLFERLDPYPSDYNNINFADYEASFRVFQKIEVCE